jgi:predicted secreted hydrolase
MTHSVALGFKVITTLGMLPMILMGSACQDSFDKGKSSAASARTVSGAQLLSLIENLDDRFPSPGPVRFPAVFLPHPQYLSESFSLRAVLDVEDQPAKIGVVFHVDKLALPAKISTPDVQAGLAGPEISSATTQSVNRVVHSDWEFSGLMRSAVIVDAAEQGVSQRESIQRIALDLAGHDETGFWVGADRLNIDTIEAGRPVYTLRANTANNQFLDLRWSLPACPDFQENGLFNRWDSEGVKLSGVIVDGMNGTGVSRSVTGLGFVSHAFGNLEFTTGAVVFDRLQLLVADSSGSRSALSILRSKRRTGRGPKTITATLRPLDNSTRQAVARRITVRWTDQDTRSSIESGFTYPAAIRLNDDSGEFSLLLTPMHGMTEINDTFGTRLQEAMTVTGSHQGVGYLDFIPLQK